ncbi:MAG: SUMF1/EgtB/PvdO family nonheme iron enzyme [Chlorobaculum sp.]|jgi:formylglycine-generating enzyme required for sulfatase activity|nr:SUMF1/EgtB/PvdO family nonheme iron enzyme [Chlorobaculum sp.]
MSDIFLSYSQKDKERVRPLVVHFERLGWSVFWDQHIPVGEDWDEYIEQRLNASRCVVVAWSTHSVNSRWVKEEARAGREKDILIPLKIDQINPPFGFGSIQTADLCAWNNDPSHEEFEKCVKAIAALVSPEDPKETLTFVASTMLPENFVLIRGGRFIMGSPESEEDREKNETRHEVKLSDFMMCKYAVTVADFKRFADESGYKTEAEKENWSFVWVGNEWSKRKGINWRHDASGNVKPESEWNHPVLHVSWNDAVACCQWLTEKRGDGTYRLPTEAEWEYACRSGATTPFSTGENLTTEEANYDGNYPYGNYPKGIYRKKTVTVDSLQPNGYGLYNMHGNVWEWCSDWYGSEYYKECLKRGFVENPRGPQIGSTRVLRGGGWSSDARRCRSACRNGDDPGRRVNDVGFRLAFVPQFKA